MKKLFFKLALVFLLVTVFSAVSLASSSLVVNASSGHVGDYIKVTYNISSAPSVVQQYFFDDGTPDGYISVSDNNIRANIYELSSVGEDFVSVCFYGAYENNSGGNPIVAFYINEEPIGSVVEVNSSTPQWWCMYKDPYRSFNGSALIGVKCLNCGNFTGDSNDVIFRLYADGVGTRSYLYDGVLWYVQPSATYYVRMNKTIEGKDAYLYLLTPSGNKVLLDHVFSNESRTNTQMTFRLNETGYYKVYVLRGGEEEDQKFVDSLFPLMSVRSDHVNGVVGQDSVIYAYFSFYDEKGNKNKVLTNANSFDCTLYDSSWNDIDYNSSYEYKVIGSDGEAYYEYYDYVKMSNHLEPGDYFLVCDLNTLYGLYSYIFNFRVSPNNQETLQKLNESNELVKYYLKYLEQSEDCSGIDEFSDGSKQLTGDNVKGEIVIDKDFDVDRAVLVTNKQTQDFVLQKEWDIKLDGNNWASAALVDQNGKLWVAGFNLTRVNPVDGSVECEIPLTNGSLNYVTPWINKTEGIIYAMKSYGNGDREVIKANTSDCSVLSSSGLLNMTVYSNALKEYDGLLWFGAYDLGGNQQSENGYICAINKSLDASSLKCWNGIGSGNTAPLFSNGFMYSGRGKYFYKVNVSALLAGDPSPWVNITVDSSLSNTQIFYPSLSPDGSYLYINKGSYTNWYTKSYYTSNMSLRWTANHDDTYATWSTSPPTWTPYNTIVIGTYNRSKGAIVGIYDNNGSIKWSDSFSAIQDENYLTSTDAPIVITQGKNGDNFRIISLIDGSVLATAKPSTAVCRSQDPVLINSTLYVCGLAKYLIVNGSGSGEAYTQKYDLAMSGYSQDGLRNDGFFNVYEVNGKISYSKNSEIDFTEELKQALRQCNSTICVVKVKVYGSGLSVNLSVNGSLEGSKCWWLKKIFNFTNESQRLINETLSAVNSGFNKIGNESVVIFKSFPTVLPKEDNVWTFYSIKNILGENINSGNISFVSASIYDSILNNLLYDVPSSDVFIYDGQLWIKWNLSSLDYGFYAMYIQFEVNGKAFYDFVNFEVSPYSTYSADEIRSLIIQEFNCDYYAERLKDTFSESTDYWSGTGFNISLSNESVLGSHSILLNFTGVVGSYYVNVSSDGNLTGYNYLAYYSKYSCPSTPSISYIRLEDSNGNYLYLNESYATPLSENWTLYTIKIPKDNASFDYNHVVSVNSQYSISNGCSLYFDAYHFTKNITKPNEICERLNSIQQYNIQTSTAIYNTTYYCLDENTLVENSTSTTGTKVTYYKCSLGCHAGACVDVSGVAARGMTMTIILLSGIIGMYLSESMSSNKKIKKAFGIGQLFFLSFIPLAWSVVFSNAGLKALSDITGKIFYGLFGLALLILSLFIIEMIVMPLFELMKRKRGGELL